MSVYDIKQSSFVNKNVDLYVNSVHTQVGNVLKAEANAVTTSFTAANIVAGIITNGAATGNSQICTAAQLVAALPSIKVGDTISFMYVSTVGDTTITTNTGFTLNGTPKVFTHTSRIFYVRFTNISSGTEACTLY